MMKIHFGLQCSSTKVSMQQKVNKEVQWARRPAWPRPLRLPASGRVDVEGALRSRTCRRRPSLPRTRRARSSRSRPRRHHLESPLEERRASLCRRSRIPCGTAGGTSCCVPESLREGRPEGIMQMGFGTRMENTSMVLRLIQVGWL